MINPIESQCLVCRAAPGQFCEGSGPTSLRICAERMPGPVAVAEALGAPAVSFNGGSVPVATPAGVSLLEQVRHVFEALVELDKFASHEVDAILTATVGHVRAWRPFILQAPEVRNV